MTSLPARRATRPMVRITHAGCQCVREVPLTSIDAATAMLGQPMECPNHWAVKGGSRADSPLKGFARDERDAADAGVKGV